MENNDFVSQDYPIKCKGRDIHGNEVLKEPVEAIIKIYKNPGSNVISSIVDCAHNCGPHGDCCDPFGTINLNVAVCPYAFDLPHALDKRF